MQSQFNTKSKSQPKSTHKSNIKYRPLIKRWGMTRLNKKIFKSPRSVESLLILTFTTCFSLFTLFFLFSFLSFLSLLVPACPSLAQLSPAWPSLAQLGPTWPNLAQLALEPIKLHFILSGVFSPREANYCSNPFEVFLVGLKL